MTNVLRIGAVTDQHNREPVSVEIGFDRNNELHFSFHRLAWAPSPREFRRFHRILQEIQWRLSLAARKDRPVKEGSWELGPFRVGVNDNAQWFIGTPCRFVYMDQNSLSWMIEAFRLALAPPAGAAQFDLIDHEPLPNWAR